MEHISVVSNKVEVLTNEVALKPCSANLGNACVFVFKPRLSSTVKITPLFSIWN